MTTSFSEEQLAAHAATLGNLKKEYRSLYRDLIPLAKRFYEFIYRQNGEQRIVFYVPNVDATTYPDEAIYNIDLKSDSDTGIAFNAYSDQEYEAYSSFVVPFKYFRDPEKFETEIAARMKEDSDALLQVYPKYKDIHSCRIVGSRPIDGHPNLVSVTAQTPYERNRESQYLHFMIDKDTRKMYDFYAYWSTLNDTGSIAGVEPLPEIS